MDRRLELQEILTGILESDHVYFQPPETLRMIYPCIVYELDDMYARFADDSPYNNRKRYSLTIIDEDPDSSLPDKIAALPMCIFNRFFTSDNLNHYVFKLYF